ncbi:MAG: hypothetical protein ABSA11_10815 [Candidatus Bathyarchaeia archaeon]
MGSESAHYVLGGYDVSDQSLDQVRFDAGDQGVLNFENWAEGSGA